MTFDADFEIGNLEQSTLEMLSTWARDVQNI